MLIGKLYLNAKRASAGSYVKLEFLPISEVDGWVRIIDDYGKFIGIRSLKSWGAWRTMPNAQGTPKPWSITSKEMKSGTQYTPSVTGQLMGGTGSDFRVLRDYQESRHLVRITLPNGRRLLLFDYDFPAEFNIKVEGEGEGLSLRRMSFNFTGKSPNEICEI